MKKRALLVLSFSLAGLFVACKDKDALINEENIIHVQIGPSPETIDPAKNSTVDGANMIIHAFEGLLKSNENNEIIPGCAESWKQSDDGLTWTFHLREGLKWSDGTKLTAEDFVYSWRRVANTETASPYGYDLLNMVVGFDKASKGAVEELGVYAPDARTFVVKLNSPCLYFDKIAASAVLVPVQQAAIKRAGNSWATEPNSYVCNGPYRMESFVDGKQIVFAKNPNYWNIRNITFNKIVWHLIKDANEAYTAYKRNEIQLIKYIPVKQLPKLQTNKEFHMSPLMGTYYVSFNTRKPPFNDARVREALSLAIDRKYLANTVMQGTYSPAKNFVGPGISDLVAGSSFEKFTSKKYGDHFNIENYKEDLFRAKALLGSAGYRNGNGFPEFEYLTNDKGYNKAVAEYLKSAWAKLGIKMNISIQDWNVVTAERRAGKFDVARNGWILDWDNPSNIINLLETNNGNNDGKYSSKEFDTLVDLARKTTNIEEHFSYLHQAEQVLLKDAAMAPLVYFNEFWMQKSNLKNVWHSPSGHWYLMYGKLE